jgi:TolB-like protein/Tfp pilus assembly protein PilF
MSFYTELRRRNVFRVAAAYALVAWIIIEAGSVLLPTFGASDTTFQVYVVVVILGFLVSLVFAWIFEITPDGVKLDKDVDRDDPLVAERKGLTNYLIIGLLVIALGVSITFNVTDIRDSSSASAADIMMSRQSIAVLPFTSRSTDSNNALFADGVHDDLLTKLANICSLKVISRTSVMEYRDTTKNLRQIGQELDVDTLLEGTVQRVGDNVRINVQLIDAETDEHLWARIYDRRLTIDNLFTVQSEVSAEIANALHATLIPTEDFEAASIPTANLRAYSLYKSGRDNLYLREPDSLQAARKQFEEAIRLDPEYAEAYIGLAESLILLTINHQALPREEAFELAQENIERGMELDAGLSDAYATLGLLRTNEWMQTRIGTENLDAEAAFEQALALNPNNAQAYMWFASLRDAEQRPDEAIGYYHRSMQLDPLGRVPYNNLPTLYAQRGDNEYATKLWLDAIALHPDWAVPYQLLSAHLSGLGRLDEAIAWLHNGLEAAADSEHLANMGFGIYAQFGDLEKSRDLIEAIPSDHPMGELARGFLMVLEGQYAAASAYLDDLIESGRNVPIFTERVASDAALLAGDYDTAREHLYAQNPVLQLDTDFEVDRFTVRDIVKLAFILREQGDSRRSVELLNAALPVVQSLPRFGIYGQGVRDAQIFAILGQHDAALATLGEAVDLGYRTSLPFDQWTLRMDPYFQPLHSDERFVAILDRLDALNAEMYEKVLEAETTGDWQSLTALTGAT